jgi:hypothetical protein
MKLDPEQYPILSAHWPIEEEPKIYPIERTELEEYNLLYIYER